LKQLAPDLWQLRGFPPNAINVYLAEDVLIDAATRRAGRRILRQIEDRPLSLVALTHVHPDHQGAVAQVCEARGVPLACHADDVDAMEGRRPVQSGDPNHPINKLIRRVWEGPPHRVDRVLQEGDEVAGFRVLHAPGHQRGEVIYFRDSDRVAIAGDVIFNLHPLTGIPGVREPPDAFTLDPVENRRSIRKLLELRPSVVCVGHGPPLRDISKLERLVAELPSP
jgi:glyoxylase-like metal-dependent hydrolase (beta-lactamase superfamily II)